jgi:hypothetical protein
MSSRFFGAGALALSAVLLASAGDARPNRRLSSVPVIPPSHSVAFMGTLHDGRVATIYTDGRVMLAEPRGVTTASKRRRLELMRPGGRRPAVAMLNPVRYGPLEGDITPAVRAQILFDLEHPPQPYAPGRVLVVFKPGVTIPQDKVELSPSALLAQRRAILSKRLDVSPQRFTTDSRLNLTLMQLGIDRSERLFSQLDRGTLSSMRSKAEVRARRSLVAFDNAFALHVGAGSVEAAVRRLRTDPSVAYVAPDFTVQSMIAGRRPVPTEALKEISGYRRSTKTFGRSIKNAVRATTLPGNTAIAFNLQAMLNAPGVDAVAAFDEIAQRFGQLPGAGTIITNVGLGDADDASAAANPADPCNSAVSNGGPTTHIIGGQRYLDWPSLPLIPVWVSDANANLSPTAEVCNVDPSLAEVGLDFSVMAPLPDDLQRPGEQAAVGADLLGIAPGASYRWVAPGTTNGAVLTSDTLAAMIGAARQRPAPDVITVSIGFGADVFGFPGRYLEDDPLAQSVVAGIVSANVVVCIAANDGTRLATTAAIGPSGGSAATNAGSTGTTNIADVFYTTAPSVIPDSGAIDVGSSTLDDIFAANPQDPAFGALANVKAFAETRYNGTLGFSSGFGSRVNVSAPGDNIDALFHAGNAYAGVGLENTGGTSASAPEVAAAAAVALQVARLTGHPFTSATQVRDFLVATGTPVANPPQSDVVANVGPQVSVRRIVEQLLATAGKPVPPGIARVAVNGRRTGSFIAQFNTRFLNDGVFVTALDPSYIKLDGPYTSSIHTHGISFPSSDTGADLNSYITIAPDWEGIPANATYRLSVAGQPSRVIATTPYARLLPAQLFARAGVPMTPGVSRTISLTYQASVGLHAIAESTFVLTFGPPAAGSRLVLAPRVPAVVSGSTLPVAYDLRGYPGSLLRAPTLNVSMPGIGNLFFQGFGLYPYYSVPLGSTNGNVDVPVSALAGAGTYTLWVDLNPGMTAFGSDISDLAFTRVDAGTARPPAPLLSLTPASPAAHTLDVPFKASFSVAYDVSNVPGATGAIVELAAPPPGPFFYGAGLNGGFNTFRNPNGNALDDDGLITGSLYHVSASGVKGSVTIDPAAAKIPATATVNVRVIPASGSTPTAEASDVGTIQYHGITSTFGLPLRGAYMNPNGSDGYLSESDLIGPFQASTNLFTIESVDVAGGVVTGLPLALTASGAQAFGLSYPFVQDDTVVATSTIDSAIFTDLRAAPLAAGFAQFAFPAGTLANTALISTVASNSTATRSAYLAVDFSTFSFLVTRGDVTTGSGFAPPVDITALLGANPDYSATATFAYDPGADRAYLLMEDSTLSCDQQSPQLLTIDFATGSATARNLTIGGGRAGVGGYQMALDPATHTAAIATSCQYLQSGFTHDTFRAELALVDLNSGVERRVFTHTLGTEQLFHGFTGRMLGGDSPIVGIDPVNHLLLQRSMFCPTVLANVDLNARPCLNEYDETGRLVKTVPGVFADGAYEVFFNGVNGSTRSGVTLGQQSSSFYFVASVEVQPYTY